VGEVEAEGTSDGGSEMIDLTTLIGEQSILATNLVIDHPIPNSHDRYRTAILSNCHRLFSPVLYDTEGLAIQPPIIVDDVYSSRVILSIAMQLQGLLTCERMSQFISNQITPINGALH
jgi:hypothetical protein